MSTEAPKPPSDVLFVHGPTADGEGVNVLRAREERLEIGQVRPLKEGKPITGEVVQLTPREGTPRAFDVKVMAKVESTVPLPGGPAQVATREYRDGWERVFGPAPTADRSLN